MKLFIWAYTGPVTESWHSSGGLAVIAADLAAARELIAKETPTDEDGDACEALTVDPDYVYELAGAPDARLFIFPDAGCC